MNEQRFPIWFLGFAMIGWLGFIGLGVPELVSQLLPKACPTNRSNNYAVFVPHYWGLDYDNLKNLSKIHYWNVTDKCLTISNVSGNIGKNINPTGVVGTYIGPFLDYSEASFVLQEINSQVSRKGCNFDNDKVPFIIK